MNLPYNICPFLVIVLVPKGKPPTRNFEKTGTNFYAFQQPPLHAGTSRMHCGKFLNQMNSSYRMAFIIWRGLSYRVTLQTPPTQSTLIISVSVTVL